MQSPMTESHTFDQPMIGTTEDIDDDDVNDDIDEPMDDFTIEDAFQKSQKVNFVASISSLYMKPHSISHL